MQRSAWHQPVEKADHKGQAAAPTQLGPRYAQGGNSPSGLIPESSMGKIFKKLRNMTPMTYRDRFKNQEAGI